MAHSFPKNEKLKSRKQIAQLFSSGRAISSFPLRLRYIESEHGETAPVKVAFAVPKKNFKGAVKRNRIKRLMREAYRLNKGLLFNNMKGKFAFLILYLGAEMPDYQSIEKATLGLLQEFIKQRKHEKMD